jgi:hypothetical protein
MRMILALGALVCASTLADTPQQHVHSMSHEVMPFDMTKTVHVFKMTVEGGEQRVEARDPVDSEQVTMIRQHLAHEATEFAKGNLDACGLLRTR